MDIYQTVAVGVLALVVGGALNRKVPLLRRLCIPSPVTGGLLFSLVTLAIYCTSGLETGFDSTIKDLCMTMFFTAVGFQSDLTLLKKGGKPLLFMVLIVFALIVIQNLAGIGVACAWGKSPLLGMAAGSIPMCGGHGTAGGFSALLEKMGLQGAGSIAMAAATFGLIAGSLLGAPLSDSLIRRNGLVCPVEDEQEDSRILSAAKSAVDSEADPVQKAGESANVAKRAEAVFAIFVAMGMGTLMNKALALLGISFPTYFGSLLVAALIRNFTELVPSAGKLPVAQITGVGSIALEIFLGIAMMSLRLWELAELALPLVTILIVQVLLMWFYARFAVFPLLGGDYNAAVLTGGVCGFGLGATPNAMANMKAVCSKHGYSSLPFIVVPLVGAIFVDIINVTVITVFLNVIG